MSETLEDLIAKGLVLWFNESDIPADVDREATRVKYGFNQFPDKGYNFSNRDGKIFYNKADAVAAKLTPQPNGTMPTGIVWEAIVPDPVDVVVADARLLVNADLSGDFAVDPATLRRVMRVMQADLRKRYPQLIQE